MVQSFGAGSSGLYNEIVKSIYFAAFCCILGSGFFYSPHVNANNPFRTPCEQVLHHQNLLAEFHNTKTVKAKLAAATALLDSAGIHYKVAYKGILPLPHNRYLTNIDLSALADHTTWISRYREGNETKHSNTSSDYVIAFDPTSEFEGVANDSVVLQREFQDPPGVAFTFYLSQSDLIRVVEARWENKNLSEKRPYFEMVGWAFRQQRS